MKLSKGLSAVLATSMANSACASCQYQAWNKREVCASASSPQPTAWHSQLRNRSKYSALSAHAAHNSFNRSKCDVTGRGLQYLAVIARWDEDVSWRRRLPIPSVVYEHAKPSATYSVPVNKGSETSSYIQFILDHYLCLPRWVLFLHGHGQTPGSGPRESRYTRHHPSDPAAFAALLDVDAIGKGFLGLGHFSHRDWASPGYLHPAAKAFSAPRRTPAARGGHRQQQQQRVSRSLSSSSFSSSFSLSPYHAAFEPVEKGKAGCYRTCDAMRVLVEKPPQTKQQQQQRGGSGGSDGGDGGDGSNGRVAHYRGCKAPYSWSVGAEFWASAPRIRRRSFAYWQAAMTIILTGREIPRYGRPGSFANAAGYCFESIWHHILGEPLYGYTPPFRLLDDLPLVDRQVRCAQAAARSQKEAKVE